MLSEKEKMIQGQLYKAGEAQLVADRRRARKLAIEINQELDDKKRSKLVKKAFGATGESVYLEPTVRFDYGYNIEVGENFYANYDCILLDICPIKIGKNVMLAPRVQLYTATHPLDPTERNSGLEYGKAISIGDNCWLGGGVIVCPGVTLGNNVVVGAGSVVTKSFPDDVVLAGNPARVIKTLSEVDEHLK